MIGQSSLMHAGNKEAHIEWRWLDTHACLPACLEHPCMHSIVIDSRKEGRKPDTEKYRDGITLREKDTSVYSVGDLCCWTQKMLHQKMFMLIFLLLIVVRSRLSPLKLHFAIDQRFLMHSNTLLILVNWLSTLLSSFHGRILFIFLCAQRHHFTLWNVSEELRHENTVKH